MRHLTVRTEEYTTLRDLRQSQRARTDRTGQVSLSWAVLPGVSRLPRLAAETGGCLYWSVGGMLRGRQRLLEAVPGTDASGRRATLLVLDPEIVECLPRADPNPADRGVLAPADAPPDAPEGAAGPRVLDAFCGCGGLSEGFRRAGWGVAGGLDAWTSAVDAYNANLPGRPGGAPAAAVDLSDAERFADLARSYRVDAIAAAPPCQDFSSAGARSEGARADLTPTVARAVKAAGPTWFVIENVPRIRRSLAWRRAKAILGEDAGPRYGLTEVVLDAADYGVPQTRKRVFLIGRLDAPDGFLEPDLMTAARAWVSVRECFEAVGHRAEVDFLYQHPHNYGKKAIYSIDRPSPTIRGINRPMPASYADLRHAGAPNDADPRQLPAGRVRAPTSYERGLLQGFPPDWVWPEGPKHDVDLMIGNAVPVGLAEAVAGAMRAYDARRAETRRTA